MNTRININQNLSDILSNEGIQPEHYAPAYGGESAGLDLYNATGKDLLIRPASSNPTPQLIGSGLKVAVPKGYVALLRERGSVTKSPLVLRAGVIDPGYTGEIFVNLVNLTNDDYSIAAGAKLPVQLIVVPASTCFEPLTDKEFENFTRLSLRKENKVGSSDKKEQQ